MRDVIKKGNRVLEEMLVRRERKYTLFFRLVQDHDVEQVDRMKAWNAKVEKAVDAVTGGQQSRESYTQQQQQQSTSGSGGGSVGRSYSGDDSDASTLSASSIGSQSTGSVSGRVGVFSRGRQLLPSAGRVRARRATPTPRLRKYRHDTGGDGDSAADGYSATTAQSDLMSLSSNSSSNNNTLLGNKTTNPN